MGFKYIYKKKIFVTKIRMDLSVAMNLKTPEERRCDLGHKYYVGPVIKWENF
jgi:hypothetical protein